MFAGVLAGLRLVRYADLYQLSCHSHAAPSDLELWRSEFAKAVCWCASSTSLFWGS
jgi:hypothetical protein